MSDLRLLPKEFPRDPVFKSLLEDLVAGSLTPQEASTAFWVPGVGFHRSLFYLILHLTDYRKWGSQTFIVPQEMQRALRKTDLTVEAPDIKLPYPALYVATPDSGLRIWGGKDTQWHEVEGAFVTHTQGRLALLDPVTGTLNIDGDRPRPHFGLLNIYLWGKENSRSKGLGDDASLWLALDLDEMHERGQTLDQYVQNLFEDPKRDVTSKDYTSLGKHLDFVVSSEGAPKEGLFQGATEAIRILMNAVLYIDSQEADLTPSPETEDEAKRKELEATLKRLKSSKKRKRVENQLAKLPRERIVWLGKNSKGSVTEPLGERSPGARHWVRGHWWPRRDQVRKRIAEGEQLLMGYKMELLKLHKELGLATREKVPLLLAELMEGEKLAQDLTSNLDQTHQMLKKRLRWVQPYIRNAEAGVAIEGHEYRLQGSGDPPAG